MMSGSKEDAETVSAFFRGMRSRGLGDPLPVASDGASGIVKAIDIRFPRTARQLCLAHRMRNLAPKVPEELWPGFKARVQTCCQAPLWAIARDPAADAVADREAELPLAMACFMNDFEACIAHLMMPVNCRRAICTTNLLERLSVEERRRLRIIPNAFGEKAMLKADVRGHYPGVGTLAEGQDHAPGAAADAGREGAAERRLRGRTRPRRPGPAGPRPVRSFQQN